MNEKNKYCCGLDWFDWRLCLIVAVAAFIVSLSFLGGADAKEMAKLLAEIFVGIGLIYFAYAQLEVQRQKRKDDLFKLRYSFYQDIQRIWFDLGKKVIKYQLNTTHAGLHDIAYKTRNKLSKKTIECTFLFGENNEVKESLDNIISICHEFVHIGGISFDRQEEASDFQKKITNMYIAGEMNLSKHYKQFLKLENEK